MKNFPLSKRQTQSFTETRRKATLDHSDEAQLAGVIEVVKEPPSQGWPVPSIIDSECLLDFEFLSRLAPAVN